MSYEAWGDDDTGLVGYVTEDRAEELFRAGAQAMREMLARFVEQGKHLGYGPDVTAKLIRSDWHPGWGPDPGRPDEVVDDPWKA